MTFIKLKWKIYNTFYKKHVKSKFVDLIQATILRSGVFHISQIFDSQ